VGVEGVVTAIVDQYPKVLRRGHRKELFIGFVCCLQFLVGLPMVCPVSRRTSGFHKKYMYIKVMNGCHFKPHSSLHDILKFK